MRYSTQDLDAPFGLAVEGVDLGDLTQGDLSDLAKLLSTHRMLVLRHAGPTDQQQVEFARHFGPLNVYARGVGYDQGLPELLTLSNDPSLPGIAGTQRLHWHTNLSYQRRVAKFAIAHVPMDVPASAGGRTIWTDTAQAYDDVDVDLRRRLEGLRLHHTQHVPGLPSMDVIHDVVREFNGRKALYDVGPAFRPDGDRPGRGKVFPALSEDDSRSLLRELSDHSTKLEYQYTHTWEAGDVIIWDNITTMHMREAVLDPTFQRTLKVVDVLEETASGLNPMEPGSERFMDF